MLKNKLLSIAFLSLTGFLYSNFEIRLLDQENIGLVTEKADIYYQNVLNYALHHDDPALVCFLPSGEVCGFLSANYPDSDAKLNLLSISVFNMDKKKEIIIALLNSFEKRCKSLGKKNIFVEYSSDDKVMKQIYNKLGYQEISFLKKSSIWLLQHTFGYLILDSAAKGVFIKNKTLCKKL
ncbi:MAG: hypothetical protein WC747_04190 [Candidatus Babeliales bacterium]|jgi:hypothetical protein